MPSNSMAQTTSSIADLLKIVEQLQVQILDLKAQIEELRGSSATKAEVKEIRIELKLLRSLQRGSTGKDVEELQTFLSQFEDVYPEALVTGYFGPLTEKAVQRWQAKENIVSSGSATATGFGRVGPKTLAKLNSLITDGAGKSGNVPAGLLTAPGIQKKLATSTKTKMGAIPAVPAIPSTGGGGGGSATPATPAVPPTQDVCPNIGGTQASVPSGMILDGNGDCVSEPDTTSPVISNLQATDITENSATITWDTDELADSKVYLNTVPIIITATTTEVFINSSSVISHSINLTNLNSNITYYYLVVSADGNSNVTTSSEANFTALLPAGWSVIENASSTLLDTAQNYSVWNGTNYGNVSCDGWNCDFYLTDQDNNVVSSSTRFTYGVNNGRNGAHVGWDGSNFGVTWHDYDPNGARQIFFTRFSASGEQNITFESPVLIYDNVTDYNATQITSLSSGDDWAVKPRMVWADNKYGIVWVENSRRITFVTIDSDGNKTRSIIYLTNGDYQILFPKYNIAWNGTNFEIVWKRENNGILYLATGI